MGRTLSKKFRCKRDSPTHLWRVKCEFRRILVVACSYQGVLCKRYASKSHKKPNKAPVGRERLGLLDDDRWNCIVETLINF